MDAVLLVTQASNGALSGRRFSAAGSASLKHSSKLRQRLSSRSRLRLHSRNFGKPLHLTHAVDGEPGPSTQATSLSFPVREDDTVFVGDEGVPLEGVIQFDKPSATPSLLSWAILALLSGGDMLCLLAFSAIGRFSHGLPVADFETSKLPIHSLLDGC
ncbi:hypothetical protein KSP40_PGU018242 [Platanthera guangdongensis]|uniref:Uncharacterized protein n=1 Tax=Platanthera guangdongensis TaxID=2320717 RepID=A0ABR2MEE0_9ASPA